MRTMKRNMTPALLLITLALVPMRCRVRSADVQDVATIHNDLKLIASSVCVIAADPRSFYGKRVQVVACVFTDGIERTILQDPACPYVGVGVVEAENLPPRQRISAAAGDSEVCGTFVGTFKPPSTFANALNVRERLEIEETRNLTTARLRK
jgi:hypothetical protein